MTDRRDHISELADAVAAGREIAWDDELELHPDLAGQIENLQRLEDLAGRFAGLDSSPDDEHPSSPSGGRSWGHLRLVTPLASGSFGEVWRAFDPVLQREVALKLRLDDAGGAAPAREFISEARRLAKVRHPNILGVHGADIHDGRVGLWAELLDGDTLEHSIEMEEPFSVDRRLEIGRDLARALAAVHDAGLVHGDVKAANIAVERDGRAVLMDFGAGVDLASADGRGASYGSPLSAAPERLEGAPLEPSADIWSLGVLLYRLADGGRFPFEAADVDGLRKLHRDPRGAPVGESLTSTPRILSRLIDAMLDPDPTARPSAAAVADRLRFIAHAPLRRRRRLAVALIIGSLAIGAVVSGIGFLRANTAANEAETARRDAEEVNRFLREILWAPRVSHGGEKVLMTEVLDGAAKRVESTLPEGSAARAQILEILGGTLVNLERYEEAEPLLRNAWSELSQVTSPTHPETISAKILLAQSIREQGRLEEAEQLLEEAAELLEAVPPGHPVHVWLRNTQAGCARAVDDVNRAESLLVEARALATAPEMTDPAPRQYVEILLADIWNRMGNYQEVIAMLEPLVDDLEATYGLRYGNTLIAMGNLAIAYTAVDRLAESRELFTTVADTAEAWLGLDHEYSFRSRMNAIISDRALGRDREAAAACRQLVGRAAELYGPNHAVTISVEITLAQALKNTGEIREAEALMKDTSARANAHLRPSSSMTLVAEINRAELLLETGRFREALALATATRERAEAIVGTDHPIVLAADTIIGGARCATGETGPGLRLLESTLEAQRKIGGPKEQQALITQIRLGAALHAAGEIDRATEVLDEAVSLCDESLVPGHPIARSAHAAHRAVGAAQAPTR